MEFLNDYIVLVVLGICLCFGYVIKHWIPNDKVNKYIPTIMLVLGAFVNVWFNAWAFTPEILLGGMASGLASTGLHQLFKQFIEKTKTEE